MANEIIPHKDTGLLEKLGSPQERQYLIEVMAEKLGIPAREASRPDVLALISQAAERNMNLGWMPGIHMHVQKFQDKESREAQKKNPNAPTVYNYTLVDGEKAWKDSGAAWRTRHGVRWIYQDKAMKQEEIEEEVRLMGFTEQLPANAFGVWSRVIDLDLHDKSDPDTPMWSAGLWFGKVKVGHYWNNDALPTGVSARNVAIRRAHKRAMMESHLALLPVDTKEPAQRITELRQDLEREAQHKKIEETPRQRPREYVEEPDGDILFATNASHDEIEEAQFSEMEEDTELDEQAEDTQTNTQEDTQTNTQEDTQSAFFVEREGDVEFYNDQDAPPMNTNEACAAIIHTHGELPGGIADLIIEVSELDRQSENAMAKQHIGWYKSTFETTIGAGDTKELPRYVMSALCSRPTGGNSLPGNGVKVVINWMNDPNGADGRVDAMKKLAYLCNKIAKETTNE